MLTSEDITGGRAHLNGVSFQTNDFYVKAYRSKGEIKTTWRKRKESRMLGIFDNIPFLRGIMVPVELIILNMRIMIPCMILILINSYSISKIIDNNSELSKYLLVKYSPLIVIPTMLIMMLIFISLLTKVTKIGRFHAAEHMSSHAFTRKVELTTENVMKESRVHQSCGTNLAIFLLIIFCTCIMFIKINAFYSVVLSWAVGYEIWITRSEGLKRLLKVVYDTGGVCQYLFFTSKPTNREIEVAIAALKELQRLHIDKK